LSVALLEFSVASVEKSEERPVTSDVLSADGLEEFCQVAWLEFLVISVELLDEFLENLAVSLVISLAAVDVLFVGSIDNLYV